MERRIYEWVKIEQIGKNDFEISFKEANKHDSRIRFETNLLRIDAVLLRDAALKHLTDYFDDVDTRLGNQTFFFSLSNE